MKELIEYIVKFLVDKPDEVVISELAGERTVVYELRVASADIGNVIGKRGRIVRSMQTILSAIAARQKSKRPLLEILKQPRTDLQPRNAQ